MNNTYNLSALDRIAEALEAMSGTSAYGNKYVVNFNFDETAEKWVMDKEATEIYGAIGKGVNVIGHCRIYDTRDTWLNVGVSRYVSLDADPAHEEYEFCFFGNDRELILTYEVYYKPEEDEHGVYKKDSAGNLIYGTEIRFKEYLLTPND